MSLHSSCKKCTDFCPKLFANSSVTELSEHQSLEITIV